MWAAFMLQPPSPPGRGAGSTWAALISMFSVQLARSWSVLTASFPFRCAGWTPQMNLLKGQKLRWVFKQADITVAQSTELESSFPHVLWPGGVCAHTHTQAQAHARVITARSHSIHGIYLVNYSWRWRWRLFPVLQGCWWRRSKHSRPKKLCEWRPLWLSDALIHHTWSWILPEAAP